jgi:hypothetical protein
MREQCELSEAGCESPLGSTLPTPLGVFWEAESERELGINVQPRGSLHQAQHRPVGWSLIREQTHCFKCHLNCPGFFKTCYILFNLGSETRWPFPPDTSPAS